MSTLFETGIRPAIDAHLKKRSEEKRNYGEYWSASSAGYCMRLNILKRLNVPPVPEIAEDQARTIRVFESGHIFHEYMQRITKEAGLSIAQELELQDEDLLVRGHIDDLVLIEEPEKTIGAPGTGMVGYSPARKRLILYDYKTANSQAFNYKRDEIGRYHKMQLATYMYMLNRMTGSIFIDTFTGKAEVVTERLGDVDKNWLKEARILQISKDDLRMREQQLIWSPQLEKDVVGYWRTLQGYWEKKVLPACTCHLHDGGFMSRRSKKGKVYNPYFHNDAPCSLEWAAQFEETKEFIK